MFAATDPVHRIYVDKRGMMETSVAAVIEFTADAHEMKRIQAFLDRLAERGIIKPAVARKFDPDYTSAELYFP